MNLHVPSPIFNDYQPVDSFLNVYSGLLPIFIFIGHPARGILVPQPGIEPTPPGVEAQSPNHWTTREVPTYRESCFNDISIHISPPVLFGSEFQTSYHFTGYILSINRSC